MNRACPWLGLAAALVTGVAAAGSELDAARRDAEAGTASLEQRPCPALGDRNYVRGVTQPQQLAAAADRERAFEDGAMRQLQQLMRDRQVAPQTRSELQTLASWNIAASLANWSMLQVAQQAQASPLIAPGQPDPAALVEGARERLRQTADSAGLTPDAAGIVRRQMSAVDRCAKNFNAGIFKLNQPQFDAAVDGAATLAELNRIEQQYRAKDAAGGGYGADSLDKLHARRATLAEADRVARDNANAVSAADAEKRRAEADRRQAEIRAKLPAYLAVATRFADASRNNNERGALAELSRDVVMNTPQGSYHGIDQVVAAVRQQAAAGAGGSLGTPRIEGDRIVSNGNSGAYRIFTAFGFDAQDRISRIDITL